MAGAARAAHLVDAEADGVHVLPHLPLPPPVLLDEAHQEGAAALPVLLVLVLLLQLDQVLRVHPEGICGRRGAGLSHPGHRGPEQVAWGRGGGLRSGLWGGEGEGEGDGGRPCGDRTAAVRVGAAAVRCEERTDGRARLSLMGPDADTLPPFSLSLASGWLGWETVFVPLEQGAGAAAPLLALMRRSEMGRRPG